MQADIRRRDVYPVKRAISINQVIRLDGHKVDRCSITLFPWPHKTHPVSTTLSLRSRASGALRICTITRNPPIYDLKSAFEYLHSDMA
jgi:hypothetical protein